jgi:NRAMP (natural resistance-associated macrophage protein)-like metal ion transporter
MDTPEPPSAPTVGPSKPRLLRILGPGLITGASDDDPSGIATYTQAGAQFGFGLTWTLLFTYPLMAAVQEISGRIGRASGRGLAGNIHRHYPGWMLQTVVALLVLANIANIAADLGAMGDVLALVVPGPRHLYVVVFAAIIIASQVLLEYTRYVAVLKWLTVSLFAYFGTALAVHVDWAAFAHGFFVPHLAPQADMITVVVAVFGTTISPYLFFWQASQEAEDVRAEPERQILKRAPEQAPGAIRRIRLDTYVGMGFSNLVALAIMVTAAATLNQAGLHDVATSDQAAQALRPIAGEFAFALFAAGVIGTGLLAVPVLAGSAAYALGEARKWPVGLSRQPHEARAFYAAVALAALLGAVLNFTPISPMRALFWSAVINGVVAVPVMACMMLMSGRRRVMGPAVASGTLRFMGWLATAVMAASVVAMFVTMFV